MSDNQILSAKRLNHSNEQNLEMRELTISLVMRSLGVLGNPSGNVYSSLIIF